MSSSNLPLKYYYSLQEKRQTYDKNLSVTERNFSAYKHLFNALKDACQTETSDK